AVVHVDEGGARLQRAVHRFDPLGAVVEVERDVILPGLPGLETPALGVAAEAEAAERARDPPAARGEVGVPDDAASPHHGPAAGDLIGDALLDEPEVHEHGG